MAFIDVSKAFGKVPRIKIWKCARERNVDCELYRVMKPMYKETTNCVISRNMKSEMSRGVRQGGRWSSLLFIAFTDEMIINVK